MNGEAVDYESLADMIRQTWPDLNDEWQLHIVGILTADSGALSDLAEAIDDRSDTPDDGYALWCELVGSLEPSTLAQLGDWNSDLDGCNYLLQVVNAW
jgi:hypothetical protein